jgi:hypothetical protein
LRRYQGKDTQYIALPAGLIAGMAFFFYRGNTIALYFMWKAFQVGLVNYDEKRTFDNFVK